MKTDLPTMLLPSAPVYPSPELIEEHLLASLIDTQAHVSAGVTDYGITITINGKTFSLPYPEYIWKRYPKEQRKILSENLAFCYTFFLPYLIPALRKIIYDMPLPLADPFLFKGFSYAIPSIALLDKEMKDRNTVNLLRKLFAIDFVFSNKKTELPKFRRSSNHHHVVMPFTFGKDSLITLGLCRELGLEVYPVYVSEPHFLFEYQLKKKLARDFVTDMGITVDFLDNTFGVLREGGEGTLGWELLLTHYSLMLLPHVYAYDAAYVFYSNEQSCNESIIDNEGFRCNPVFEQSSSWLMQNSLMASLIGGNSLTIGSLIEPLNDLAIIKILHSRYKDLAKYQMSCDPEDKERNRLGDQRWCENCSKCARIYILLLANGIDPKLIGFVHDLLDEKYRTFYSMFGTSEKVSYGYDATGVGREEQMFAFYLAYKNGAKGKLMDEFKKTYLKEIKKYEADLRKKYFGIHTMYTVPETFRPKLMRIFREELKSLC